MSANEFNRALAVEELLRLFAPSGISASARFRERLEAAAESDLRNLRSLVMDEAPKEEPCANL